MEFGKVEQLRDEVVGLRPVYGDIGNCTELLLKSGEIVLDKRSLNGVKKALAMAYAIDLKAQRRQLQASLKRKGGPFPFYLSRKRVFIPLKMRRVVSDNDAVYGYLDLDYIDVLELISSRKCIVKLSNALRLEVLSSRQTMLGAQHDGVAVREFLHKQVEKVDNGISDEQLAAAVRLIISTITKMVPDS
ncbi:MAG: hypothetical protein ABFD18_12575 [Syntrophomonas sp.]